MDIQTALSISLYVSIALGFIVIIAMYSEYIKYKQELSSKYHGSFRIVRANIDLA